MEGLLPLGRERCRFPERRTLLEMFEGSLCVKCPNIRRSSLLELEDGEEDESKGHKKAHYSCQVPPLGMIQPNAEHGCEDVLAFQLRAVS